RRGGRIGAGGEEAGEMERPAPRFPRRYRCRADFDHAIARRLAEQPIRLARLGGRLGAALPARQRPRRFGSAHDGDLLVRREGDQIAFAQDFGWCAGGAPPCPLLDRPPNAAPPPPPPPPPPAHP